MRIIAHRGLLEGPDEQLQNTPEQIQRAVSAGFDAEIDVWYQDSEWFLGHDGPEHKIEFEFLLRPQLWIHCKNLAAWNKFRSLDFNLHYFWHESDMVVLTSQGICWTYFGKPETLHNNSVCVMPEVTYDWDTIETMMRRKYWYGYCTDYPLRIEGIKNEL